MLNCPSLQSRPESPAHLPSHPLASLLLGLLHEFLAAALLRHATGSSVAASASGRSTIKRSQYGQLAGSVGGILSLFLPSIHSSPKLVHSNRAGRRRC